MPAASACSLAEAAVPLSSGAHHPAFNPASYDHLAVPGRHCMQPEETRSHLSWCVCFLFSLVDVGDIALPMQFPFVFSFFLFKAFMYQLMTKQTQLVLQLSLT